METLSARAVVFDEPRHLKLARLELSDPQPGDVVVETEFSGVSTGTERLLWSGDMPFFPGLSYPLVPGYETVGRVVRSDERPDLVGRRVFAGGARCYKAASGLFGATASRLVLPADKVIPISFENDDEAVLLALAATAYHAVAGSAPPELIVGHGVLGRLLARICIALGAPTPVVWEINPERGDADGYPVIEPELDGRVDYARICDVSGDPTILDKLIAALAPGGEITLAGFYSKPLGFAFPPAFMKEARIRVAAEWKPQDLAAVVGLIDAGKLSLGGLITHRFDPADAEEAYRVAFEDPACLKLVLDWRKRDVRTI
ncbi:MAG: chlorophyll synthesis pathway protein BchC [Alphaproteobacteria bacterium]|nr:chlorophyll synthesis pathway protein BchC [Alphaproteobacteria bacterium]